MTSEDSRAVVNTHCPVEAALLSCLTDPPLVARGALLAALNHVGQSWGTTNPLATTRRVALLQQLQVLSEAHEALDRVDGQPSGQDLLDVWLSRQPLHGPPQSLMLLLHVRLQLLQRLSAHNAHDWLLSTKTRVQLHGMQALQHGSAPASVTSSLDIRGGYLAPAAYVLRDIKQQRAGDLHVQRAVHTASLRLHAAQAASLHGTHADHDTARITDLTRMLASECALTPGLLDGADPAQAATVHGCAGADAALAVGIAQLQLHAWSRPDTPTHPAHLQSAFCAFMAAASATQQDGMDDANTQRAALHCAASLQVARLCLRVLVRDGKGGCQLDVGGEPASVAAGAILAAMHHADGTSACCERVEQVCVKFVCFHTKREAHMTLLSHTSCASLFFVILEKSSAVTTNHAAGSPVVALHFSHVLSLLADHPSLVAPVVQARWQALPLGVLVPWAPQMLSACGPGADACVQETLLPMLLALAKGYTQHVRGGAAQVTKHCAQVTPAAAAVTCMTCVTCVTSLCCRRNVAAALHPLANRCTFATGSVAPTVSPPPTRQSPPRSSPSRLPCSSRSWRPWWTRCMR